MAIIYKITNKIDGKIYIGQTVKTLTRRWAEHCSAAKTRPAQYFHKAIAKYGCDAFVLEIVETLLDQEQLDFSEKRFIALYETTNSQLGYNISEGGQNGGITCPDFGERVSKGKLASKTKRPDARERMLARDPTTILNHARLGGYACRGKPKGGFGSKGSSGNIHAKSYEITRPDGSTIVIKNLSEFCRANDLSRVCMLQTASSTSRVKSHKGGWRAKRINDT